MNRTVGMIVARGWTSLVAFATFVAVGRTLAPPEFGLFALASAMALLPHGLTGAGFYERAMWKDDGEIGRRTLFWASVSMGALGSAVTVALAMAAMRLFPGSLLGALLLALAPTPILQGAGAILEAQLLRRGQGGRLAAVLVLAEASGFAALVSALALGQGVFALVWSRIVNQGVVTTGFLVAASGAPRLGLDLALLRQLRGLIGDMIGARLISWADGYAGDMIIAALLSTGGVGIFRMGSRLWATVASVLINAPGSVQTANAGRAAARGPHGVALVTSRMVRLHLALVAPVVAAFVLVVADLVRLLLNPEWSDAADVAMILALAAPAMVVSQGLGASLLVQQRSRMLVMVQIAGTLATTCALLAAAAAGPEAAALSKALVSSVYVFCAFYIVRTLAPAQSLALLRSSWAIAAAGALAGAIAWPVAEIARAQADLPQQLGGLAAACLICLGGYALAFRALAPKTFRLARTTLRWAMLRAGGDRKRALA